MKVTASNVQQSGRNRRVFGVTVRLPLTESEWNALQHLALGASLSLKELVRRTVLSVLLGVRSFTDPREAEARHALRELATVEVVEGRFVCGGCEELRRRFAAERARAVVAEAELARRDIEALRDAARRAAA